MGSASLRRFKLDIKAKKDHLLRYSSPSVNIFAENPDFSVFHALANILINCREKQVVVSVLYKLERGQNCPSLLDLRFKTKQNDNKEKNPPYFQSSPLFQKTIVPPCHFYFCFIF